MKHTYQKTIGCALGLFLFALRPIGFAQASVTNRLAPARAAAVDAAVEGECKRQEIVGLAIGIIRDGQIVYLKGYGLADREAGTPVTTRTVFNWASNSKCMTAVAALPPVEKRHMDLDARIPPDVSQILEKAKL